MEIFGKVNLCEIFLRPKICVYENFLWKNAGIERVPYFLDYMSARYRYSFLNVLEPELKRGGLFIVVLQRVLKLLV